MNILTRSHPHHKNCLPGKLAPFTESVLSLDFGSSQPLKGRVSDGIFLGFFSSLEALFLGFLMGFLELRECQNARAKEESLEMWINLLIFLGEKRLKRRECFNDFSSFRASSPGF